MLPRSTTRPLYFWIFGSNSELSIHDTKCTVLLSILTSFLNLSFSLVTKCLVWRSFTFSVPLRTMKIHPVVFHSIWWILWNQSTDLTIHDLHQYSSNRQFFLHHMSEVLVTSSSEEWQVYQALIPDSNVTVTIEIAEGFAQYLYQENGHYVGETKGSSCLEWSCEASCGHGRLWPNRLLCCVVLCCLSGVGTVSRCSWFHVLVLVKVWFGPPFPGPSIPWTAQNFALFLPSPAAKFVLFFPVWVSSRWILVVFLKAGTLKCARLGSLVVVWNPGGPTRPGRQGSHTTTKELQTRTFEGPCASNTTKIPREDPLRRKKRTNFVAGEGKKATLRGHHPSGPPPFGGPHPSGPPPFGAITLRGHHPSGPPPFGAPPFGPPFGPHGFGP